MKLRCIPGKDYKPFCVIQRVSRENRQGMIRWKGMSTPVPTFQIGPIPVYGDLLLAPMDGITDLPFRLLTRRLGSAVSYTEFITAGDVIHGTPYLPRRLAYREEERPFGFQLCDDQPDRILQAALKLCELKPDFIDINLGCSARHVSGRGAGAGLLKTPEKIAEIFSSLTQNLPVPVTAKIRLGWDENTRNYLQIAQTIVENGGALIAVHGRTRAQQYTGRADWQAIAEVVRAVPVPVIANGDVTCTADIERIKDLTGCAAVMVGRAAVGNPWIFSRLDRSQVPLAAVQETMHMHLREMLAYYGSPDGLVRFRKFTRAYLAPYPLPRERLTPLLTCSDPNTFVHLLDDIFVLLLSLPPADPSLSTLNITE